MSARARVKSAIAPMAMKERIFDVVTWYVFWLNVGKLMNECDVCVDDEMSECE